MAHTSSLFRARMRTLVHMSDAFFTALGHVTCGTSCLPVFSRIHMAR